MTYRFLSISSTYPGDLSIASTDAVNLSIFRGIFDIFYRWGQRFDITTCFREQLDAQFAESAALETQIKANREVPCA